MMKTAFSSKRVIIGLKTWSCSVEIPPPPPATTLEFKRLKKRFRHLENIFLVKCSRGNSINPPPPPFVRHWLPQCTARVRSSWGSSVGPSLCSPVVDQTWIPCYIKSMYNLGLINNRVAPDTELAG